MRHECFRRTVGFYLVSVAILITLGGCGGATDTGGEGVIVGEGGSLGSISLSANAIAPGGFLRISQGSIIDGDVVRVDFTIAGEYRVTATTIASEDDEVEIVAPAILSGQDATIGAGNLTVSVRGVNATVGLRVLELPATAGLPPGSVLRIVLESLVNDFEFTNRLLNEIAVETGTTDALQDASASVDRQLDAINDIIGQLAGGDDLAIGVDIGAAEPVSISTEQLALVDRLLVAHLQGMLTKIGAPTMNSELLAATQDGDADSAANEIRRAISSINGVESVGGRSARASLGTASAGLVLWGATFDEAAVGNDSIAGFERTAAIAAAVGEVLYNLSTAPLIRRGTESFNAANGEEFDAARQVLSAIATTTEQFQNTASTQESGTARWLSPNPMLLSGLVRLSDRGLPGRAGVGTELVNQILQVFDDITAVRCVEGQTGATIAPAEQAQFCEDAEEDSSDVFEETPSAGDDGADGDMSTGDGGDLVDGICTDECTFAVDGVCDDGGEGSAFDLCPLGTDCADCGPRDAGEGDLPGGEDGATGAFAVVFFQNTDGDTGTTATSAEISISGSMTTPVFSFVTIGNAASMTVVDAQDPEAMFGIVVQGEADQPGFAPLPTTVAYGNYNLADADPAPGFPDPSPPLVIGREYVVQISTTDNRLAVLQFKVN